jgi:hypothetical protein
MRDYSSCIVGLEDLCWLDPIIQRWADLRFIPSFCFTTPLRVTARHWKFLKCR